ncbi:MAG: M20/M25/M40 family metallo-hydrolase, partial [Acidobacteriota bacterium]
MKSAKRKNIRTEVTRYRPSSLTGAAAWALAGLLLAALAVPSQSLGIGIEGAQQGAEGSRATVEYLASDALGGRLTGTPDAAKAADYIVTRLQAFGAQPLPGEDGYRLPFDFTSGITDAGSRLQASGGLLAGGIASSDDDIRALAFSDSDAVSGPLVFAGYGIKVPESQGYPYDSFATLDLEGKIAVVLRYIPEDVDQEARALLGQYSDLRRKAMQARELGAVGLLVVTGPRSPGAGELIDMSFDSAVAGSGIVAASISGKLADDLFAAVPERTLASIQEELDTGNPHVAGFDFPAVEVTLDVKVERQHSTGYNVVGYLPPSDPTAPTKDRPFVVLGAHYDHLGHGGNGSSLARGDEVGQVHNGADDNASGVAAVIEAGAQLAGMSRERGIVLAFWSGEEFGLLGSEAFADADVPGADRIAAYLNFDMVGRARDNVLTIQAVGSSEMWPALIERTNVPIGFDVRTQDDPWVPTDSTAFNRVGVPTLSFFTGTHEQYHSPRDDADLINYEDLDRVAR